MPPRPKMACRTCGKGTRNRPAYCDEHSKDNKREKNKRYNSNRGSASSQGYGAPWRKLRLYILTRDHYMCRECGVPTGKSGHVDHIVPKGQGGTDDESNLQVLCKPCHSRKTRLEDGQGDGQGDGG